LAKAADVGVATVYKLLSDDPITTSVSLEIRDKVAGPLQFDGWWDLVARWREDDVLYRTDIRSTNSPAVGYEQVTILPDAEVISEPLSPDQIVRLAQELLEQAAKKRNSGGGKKRR